MCMCMCMHMQHVHVHAHAHAAVHTAVCTAGGEPAGSRSPPLTRQGLVACRARLGRAGALRRARGALPCPSRLAPRSSAGLSDSLKDGRRHRV
jgi:hypothetical protein